MTFDPAARKHEATLAAIEAAAKIIAEAISDGFTLLANAAKEISSPVQAIPSTPPASMVSTGSTLPPVIQAPSPANPPFITPAGNPNVPPVTPTPPF